MDIISSWPGGCQKPPGHVRGKSFVKFYNIIMAESIPDTEIARKLKYLKEILDRNNFCFEIVKEVSIEISTHITSVGDIVRPHLNCGNVQITPETEETSCLHNNIYGLASSAVQTGGGR